MLEYGSLKLLLLAVVALVVVGPKDFPVLLRTVGHYVALVRKQAFLFRQQWDDAMRESELADIKKDVEGIGKNLESTLRETEDQVTSELNDASRTVSDALKVPEPLEPAAPSPAAAAAAAAAATLPPAPVPSPAAQAAAAATSGA